MLFAWDRAIRISHPLAPSWPTPRIKVKLDESIKGGMGVAWHLQDSKTCLAWKMAGRTKVSVMIYCLWHINYSTSHENGTSYLSKFIQSPFLTWRSHRWALWGKKEGRTRWWPQLNHPERLCIAGICFLLQARRHTHIHQYIEALIHKHTHTEKEREKLGFLHCSVCRTWNFHSVCRSYNNSLYIPFILSFLLSVLSFSPSILPTINNQRH